jgi:hypothetical protein
VTPGSPPLARFLVAVLGALLLQGCGVALRFAPQSTVIPPGGVTLPTRQCARSFLVEATINGRGPYTLLLDTGAATTILSPAVADAMPEHTGPTLFAAVGAGGRTVMITRRVRVESLTVGAREPALQLSGFDAPVFDLSSFETALGGKLDGILGYPAFRDLLLTLDYPAGAVRLSTARLAPGPGTLRLLETQSPRVQFAIQGRPMKAVLDSGSGGWFMLSDSGLGARRFDYASPLAPIGSFIAVGGRELTRAGRLRGSATLGPLEIEEPLLEPSRHSALIGAKVMQHAAIDFDQRSRLVRFRPAVSRARAEPIFGIGIATVPEHNQVRVTDVFPDLPAARAGLRPGDIIEEVNGRRTLDLICQRDRLFEREGPAVLLVTRDGTPVTVHVDVVALVP